MSVNWETSFKKYIARIFKKEMGFDMDVNNISKIIINTDVDLSLISLYELGWIYAFSIMQENFEQSNLVKEELKKRNCEIDLYINEMTKEGVIDLYIQPKTETKCLEIKLKVLPDGLMIDFDKEDLL